MAKTDQFEKPEGFQEHHRRKGDRQRQVRGAETIIVDAETHKWIEEHPEEARKLGWSVSRSEDPLDVPIVIPAAPKERKERGPRSKEKPRNRATVQVRVPKDEQEDGAGVLDDRIDILKAVLGPEKGWTPTVSAYFPVADGLGYAIQALRDELGDKEFKKRLREWAKAQEEDDS